MTLPAPMAPFTWIDTPWGPALHCEPMGSLARHVFSARGLDVPHADLGTGWGALADWLGVEESRLWRLRQVHGVTVHTDGVACCDGAWPEGDLLATDRTDDALAVRTADCVPILFADARTGTVAAVHAGWRGTVAAAAARMVETLSSRFGSSPQDLVAAIGPSIGPEAYEVGAEVIEAFTAAWPDDAARGAWWRPREGAPGKFLLDLWTVTRDQLAAAGVPAGRIHLAGLCTATHARVFHSYRVDGAEAGRMVAAIRSALAFSPRRSRIAAPVPALPCPRAGAGGAEGC